MRDTFPRTKIFTEEVQTRGDEYFEILLVDSTSVVTNRNTIETKYLINVTYYKKGIRRDEVPEVAEKIAFTLMGNASDYSQVFINDKIQTTFIMTQSKSKVEAGDLLEDVNISTGSKS